MKKLLTLTTILGAVACSFGQGVIAFNNSASTLIKVTGGSTYGTNVVSLPPNNPVGSNPYMFGLFVSPQGTTGPGGVHDASWQFVGAYAVNSTATSGAGRLQNPGTPAIAGYGAGSTVNFIVRGWSAFMGNTWSQVLSYIDAPVQDYFLGTSTVAQNSILGGGAFPTPSVWGAGPDQISGLTMNFVQVPEPATFALAGLGAAAMLIFRRRK